ncbi:MAG: hypothetical protein AAGC57_18540 [Pseudomonadota bacterium]
MADKHKNLRKLNDEITYAERTNRKQLIDRLVQVERLMRELRGAMRKATDMRTQIRRTSAHLGKDLNLASQLSKSMADLEKEMLATERTGDKNRVRELTKRVRRRDKDAADRLGILAKRTKTVNTIEKDYETILKTLKKIS